MTATYHCQPGRQGAFRVQVIKPSLQQPLPLPEDCSPHTEVPEHRQGPGYCSLLIWMERPQPQSQPGSSTPSTQRNPAPDTHTQVLSLLHHTPRSTLIYQK